MKEIEIPEGYEARIEGNKVILEQKVSEDERIRRELIRQFSLISETWFKNIFNGQVTKEQMIAYLERRKEPSSYSNLEITDVVRKALQECEGYKNCRCDVYAARVGAVVEGLLQEQQSAEWSVNDEAAFGDLMWCIEQAKKSAKNENDIGNIWSAENWVRKRVKSLRPQPKGEIYKSAKHDLAIRFMNYLDENRPDGKMSLSSGECEDIDKAFRENDWAKIMRYAEKYSPSWKPSKEQMEWLKSAVKLSVDKPQIHGIIISLYEQLNRL